MGALFGGIWVLVWLLTRIPDSVGDRIASVVNLIIGAWALVAAVGWIYLKLTERFQPHWFDEVRAEHPEIFAKDVTPEGRPESDSVDKRV